MMLSLSSVAEADWPEVSAGFRDLTFEQSSSYARAAAARVDAGVEYFLVTSAGEPVAAASVRLKCVPGLRRGIAWVPSGPLIYPLNGSALTHEQILAALELLRGEICDKRGHILRLRPAGIAGEDRPVFLEAAKVCGFVPTERAASYRSSAIDLTQDCDALMTQLNGKWRTDLRYALKSNLTLEIGKPKELAARFLKLYEEVQDAKGFRPNIPPEFHFPLNGPDYSLEILIASKDGADLAGIVVGTAGQTSTYLFGATGARGRPLRAGYFLTWAGVQNSKAKGSRWYDLGGVDKEANPEVTRFKMRMNGQPIAANALEVKPTGFVPNLILGIEGVHTWLMRGRGG